MDDQTKELLAIEEMLDARGALSAENIKSTAFGAMHRAFTAIRSCIHDEPLRAGLIADAFHNLPKAIENWSHQNCREETVRAIHALHTSYRFT